MTSIAFYTFGCRLNQSETAVIENSFAGRDYQTVDIQDPADIVVINTCTVTDNGDADTRRLVNRVNRLNPRARIALIGCQAQIQKDQLLQLPNVRWVIGNNDKMRLADIFDAAGPESEAPQVLTPPVSREPFTIPVAGIDARHTRANIKIQDGCDFFCSFCEIPFARGRARSRVFSDILTEAAALTAAGHREIVVTGINVGTYAHEGKTIVDVLTAIAAVPDIERVRISSIEPTTIPDELLSLMAGHAKICRYLHIPLQSGDDGILTAMQRKYTAGEFLAFLDNAKARVPQMSIGTDVIVGFPGETAEQFETTYERLLDSPVDYFHVFSYSARNVAKSRKLPNPVDPGTIAERSRRLRELSQRKRRMFYESLLGTEQTVLFEQEKEGWWSGVTDHYARVAVKSEANLTNQMHPVRLSRVEGAVIVGELETEPFCG